MKKMIGLFLSLMLFTGCSRSAPVETEYNASPLRFYSEYQGNGWSYYAIYLEEEQRMYFTGVNLREYNLPDHYIYYYENGVFSHKEPTEIAALMNGETTREDNKKIDQFLENVELFPVIMDSLELETLDSEVVEKIVNKTFEQPTIDGKWKSGPNRLLVQRELDNGLVLSVGQVTSDEVIITAHIDIFDGESFLRDKEDLSDEEKILVEKFEKVEKEMIEKQEFLVIEDSDDPVLHELYMALRELDITGEKELN